jgi:phospholipid/cholesterol/gamma-HCH transport system ATP-binding protein
MVESLHKMPAELSGGMKKRIGLARALVLDPELILYDEPSAGLDPVTSSIVDDLIISLSEKIEATSIIVTHEMDSAFKIADAPRDALPGGDHRRGYPERFRNHENPVVASSSRARSKGRSRDPCSQFHAAGVMPAPARLVNARRQCYGESVLPGTTAVFGLRRSS